MVVKTARSYSVSTVITPPNTDVMTDGEIAEEIEQLCRLFDSLRCPFVMFGTDKVEDMSALKAYYRSQPAPV